MIPSVLPRFALTARADGLGNAPRPVALGLDADLFDTIASQRPLVVAVAEPPRP